MEEKNEWLSSLTYREEEPCQASLLCAGWLVQLAELSNYLCNLTKQFGSIFLVNVRAFKKHMQVN